MSEGGREEGREEGSREEWRGREEYLVLYQYRYASCTCVPEKSMAWVISFLRTSSASPVREASLTFTSFPYTQREGERGREREREGGRGRDREKERER